MSTQTKTLFDLPAEIFNTIFEQIQNPRDALNLSYNSRDMYNVSKLSRQMERKFPEIDGEKIYSSPLLFLRDKTFRNCDLRSISSKFHLNPKKIEVEYHGNVEKDTGHVYDGKLYLYIHATFEESEYVNMYNLILQKTCFFSKGYLKHAVTLVNYDRIDSDIPDEIIVDNYQNGIKEGLSYKWETFGQVTVFLDHNGVREEKYNHRRNEEDGEDYLFSLTSSIVDMAKGLTSFSPADDIEKEEQNIPYNMEKVNQTIALIYDDLKTKIINGSDTTQLTITEQDLKIDLMPDMMIMIRRLNSRDLYSLHNPAVVQRSEDQESLFTIRGEEIIFEVDEFHYTPLYYIPPVTSPLYLEGRGYTWTEE